MTGPVEATPAFLEETANRLETNQSQAIGINKQAFGVAVPLTSGQWQGAAARAASQVVRILETDAASLVALLGRNIESTRRIAKDMGGQEDVSVGNIQRSGNGLGLNRPADPRA